MAGRKPDPNTGYHVYIHKDRRYRYAAVQKPISSPGSNRTRYRIVHLGTVDDNLVFTPNATYRLMDVDERMKYIFPPEWDISEANILNNVASTNSNISINTHDAKHTDKSKAGVSASLEKPDTKSAEQADIAGQAPLSVVSAQYNNRLYGNFWLLENIADNNGLYDDILETFNGNTQKTNEALTLGVYPYLSGRNFSRFAKWQRTHATLIDYPYRAHDITKLTQSITDTDRMTLIRLRMKRLPSGAYVDCDSTTRSAWGRCLADIHWGKNKDNAKLPNTVETVVYSLTTHEPFYYRSFPGNTSDMTTIRTVLADLEALGIKDVVFVTDRGYASDENIAALYEADLPFLICAKVGCQPVAPLLLDIRYDSDGVPTNMKYDPKRNIYYTQVDVPTYTGKLSDGTGVSIEGLKANLFMDPDRRQRELAQINLKISAERADLEEQIRSGKIPSDIKRFNALFEYFKVSLENDENKTPIRITYTECTEKIRKEKSRCGFFSSLMHSLTLTGIEALDAYKKRDEHEKDFDQLKNQMYFYSQRNSTEEGKDGCSFLAFIGLILISYVRNVWRDSMQSEYTSTFDMIDEMEPIRLCEYSDGSTHLTSFTGDQVRICDACGVTAPYECMPKSLREAADRKANPKKRGRHPKADKGTDN